MSGRKKQFCVLFIAFLAFLAVPSAAQNVLFEQGRSDYKIVIPSRASSVERHSAKEFQDVIYKISSVRLPVVTSDAMLNGRNVYIGYSAFMKTAAGIAEPSAEDEAFTYFTKSGNLFIFGGRSAGTMYGVYSFLEHELGVHWLTSDCTIIPKKEKFVMGNLRNSQKPAMAYRHVFYFDAQNHVDWAAHNRLNGVSGARVTQEYGRFGGLWGVHSMGVLVPSATYYSRHPEYFSLRDGRRIPDGQLCLSNPNVIQLLTEKMEQVVRDNPNFHVFSLSQNDNDLFCTCRKCRAIEQRYGSHSGLMIWAVNQVAENIGRRHPDVRLMTLAYRYTQDPPVGIKPSDKVIIQLSDVHNCFAHPFTSPDNAQFLADLSGWQKLTPHIYLWDYVTNFFHYLLPYPIMHTLQSNYKLLASRNVYGVMAEGQYQTEGAGFDALNAWLIAKMMWNPNENVDSLARIFIQGYYGKAAADVMDYYQLCNNLVSKESHVVFTSDYNNPMYTAKFMSEGRSMLDRARRQVAGEPLIAKRVDKLMAQILYLEVCKNRTKAVRSGAYPSLLKIIRTHKMNINENTSADQYLRKEGYI